MARSLSSESYDLLWKARPGTVTVVAAPPGEGKSTEMAKAVVRRTMEYPLGRPPRVLWAAHGTRHPASLGQEAAKVQRTMSALGGTATGVKVIFGREHSPGPIAKYHRQFDWSVDPLDCIRIISHAHLPILLHPEAAHHFKMFLEGADVIVVDEDPLFSLLFSLADSSSAPDLGWIDVRCAVAPTRIEQALRNVMHSLATGVISVNDTIRVTHPISGLTHVSFTGKPFWEALQRDVTGPPEWSELVDALITHAFQKSPLTNIRSDLTASLEQDWRAATLDGRYSNRFGLQMQDGSPSTVVFRADIPRTVRPDTPPIVILDAYADAKSPHYPTLFPAHEVTVAMFGETKKLDVEVNTDFAIDRTNLLSGRQPKRRNHLMAEAGRLASTHAAGTLILADQDRITYLRDRAPQAHWTTHAPTLDLNADSPPIEFAYYFAGRGVNKYSGRHVIALNSPERPTLFQHHTMAALAPFDPETRKKLAQHLRRTELLQMLHRGRQTRFEANDPARPKIILAFPPDPEFSDYLNVSASTPLLPFSAHSPNPYHHHAARTLAAELFKLLGGVPHAALVALGLYKPTSQETKYLEQVRSRLKKATYHKKRKAPILTAWGRDPASLNSHFSTYDPLDGVNTPQVLAVLKAEPALTNLFAFSVPSIWTARNVRVYAETEAAAQEALRRLGGLKESTS